MSAALTILHLFMNSATASWNAIESCQALVVSPSVRPI